MSYAPCIRHLRDFVAIPSVNPMGRDDIPASVAGERRYAEHAGAQLRRLGLDVEIVGEGERASVLAEAFEPRVADGRVFGRGACDTKAGLAALVDALERVLARGTLRRNLIVVGEADEEYGSAGVRDAIAGLGARRPDWVLATEPTGLRVVTHHKGKATARLEARGRAVHSSNPAQGRNAIVALARSVVALEAHAAELAARPHPVLGPATLAVAQVHGGIAPNVVPDRAWLVLDRRVLPGEDAARVRAELEAVLRRAELSDVSVAECSVDKHALETGEGAPAVAACRAALRAAGLPVALGAVAFGTDAGEFDALAGWPGVVVGPGHIEQAHTADEWVDVAEVEAMARFFVALLEDRPAS
jgi:acetylornithine deacetylase/succinyl-diaminopimelate desuccinylase-like protein